MRTTISIIVSLLLMGCSTTRTGDSTGVIRNKIVEASCGQCQFDMVKPGCDLAIRIDGETYFVDGAGIDDFGDAHADDGFCMAVRTARVSGTIVDDRFQATAFEVLPSDSQ